MKLILSITLFLIAWILIAVLFPLAVTFVIIRGIYKRKPVDWYRSTERYFFEMAYALDKFGNVLIAPLFNSIMIVKAPQKMLFGDPDETISSCLGRNKLHDNLTWVGRLLANILDTIDENHCEKAADKFMSAKFGN